MVRRQAEIWLEQHSDRFWIAAPIWVAIALILSACGSVPSGQDPNIVWKLDANLKINGRIYNGTGVVPKSQSYEIEIYPRSRIDVAFITTCHRDKEIHAVEIKKFLGSERQFKYTYEPRVGVEDSNCPIMFNVLDQEKVTSLRGMLDFEDPFYTLMATVDCDGDRSTQKGVSICQGKEGLRQRISFSESVRLLDPPACGVTQKEGNSYFFKPSLGECPMVFQSRDGQFHRMTVIGYEATFTEEMAK